MTVVVAPPQREVCKSFNVNLNNNNDAIPASATQAVVSYDNQPSQTQTLTNGRTAGPFNFTAVGSGVQPISVTYLDSSNVRVGGETGSITVIGGAAGSINTTLTTAGTPPITSATTTLVCSGGTTQLNGTVFYSVGGTVIATAPVVNGVVANPTVLGQLATGTVVTVTFVQTGAGCAFCSFEATQVVVGGGTLCQVVLEPVQEPVFVNQPVTVIASVTCNGVPVVGATIQFTGGGMTASDTTGVGGVASATLTFTTPGTFTVNATVTTPGDSECPCTGVTATPISVIISPLPTCQVLLVTPGTVVADQPTPVSALVTCNGSPVAGATITFTGGATPVFANTGTNGVASTSVTFTGSGPTTLTATVTNSPTTTCACTGSSTTVPIQVTPQPACCVILLPPEDEVVVGEPINLTAVVLCNCTPVVGASVQFTGGPAPVTGVTDTNGIASAQIVFTAPGTATVTATVTTPGDSQCPCTNVASQPVVIKVKKEKKPKLKAFPACWEVNLPIPFPHQFRAKLRAEITPPVEGQRVDFYVGDDFVGFALTDATGNATLQAGLSPLQIISPFYKAVANVGSTRLEATSLLLPCIPPV